MNATERTQLRAVAAQIYKLAELMRVNVEPTLSQVGWLKELAAELLRLANAT